MFLLKYGGSGFGLLHLQVPPSKRDFLFCETTRRTFSVTLTSCARHTVHRFRGVQKERTLASVSHPKRYDQGAVVSIRAVFHEVWEVLQPRHDLYGDGGGELKAAIIRRLIDLVADGTTNPEELKAKVLKNLPLA